MKQIFLATICFVSTLIVSDSFAQEKAKETDESAKLQGEWILISVGFGDYELRGTPERPMKVTFTKDEMLTRPRHAINRSSSTKIGFDGITSESWTGISLSEQVEAATFKLDMSKSPAHLDLDVTISKTDKRLRKSIFKLDANDLKICVGTFFSRPTEFKTSNTDIVLTLKRVEKKNQAAGEKPK